MKSRPILFSAPMVRAILEGRKTQTRRAAKLNASGRVALSGKNWHCADPDASLACPYGQPGDQLWVREAFAYSVIDPDGLSVEDDPENYDIIYRATDKTDGGWTDGCGATIKAPWKPSIHMPRWASRITLEIVSVRVERLQDISEADAQAEGAKHNGECDHIRHSCAEIGCFGPNSYRGGYAELWDRINGAGSWAANPWVWCVEFKRIEN